jgi:hypothetical protein
MLITPGKTGGLKRNHSPQPRSGLKMNKNLLLFSHQRAQESAELQKKIIWGQELWICVNLCQSVDKIEVMVVRKHSPL